MGGLCPRGTGEGDVLATDRRALSVIATTSIAASSPLVCYTSVALGRRVVWGT